LEPGLFTGPVGSYGNGFTFREPEVSLSDMHNYVVGDPNDLAYLYASDSPEESKSAKSENFAITSTEQESTKDVGDPVSLSTGDFTYDNTLMRLPGGNMPYRLDIRYRSQARFDGPIGQGWDHGYDHKLVENPDGSVTYSDGSLSNHTFVLSGSSFAYMKGLDARLVKTEP
jgi:hypothetical protein